MPRKTKKSSKPKPKAKPKKAKARALDFNHAMVYARDVERSLNFYCGLLGMKKVDEFRYEGKPIYARLCALEGEGTIAIHQLGPGASTAAEGVRLYFETPDLDDFCRALQAKGFYITQLPRMMPWGWKHAYLNDPDGHEISLYWAAGGRMKKTVMQAARKAAKAR
ncbi:MAG: VOC family protein [Terriglobales bacterium]